jgi:uncharacterized membrane protein
MASTLQPRRSVFASAIFHILDPIPYGCFFAALIFDIVYFRSGSILWDKAAAWLIALGLIAAIVPRLINLAQVWISSRAASTNVDRFDFALNLIAIVVGIVNAFVHSRDAYGSMPEGVWLSALTVILLTISRGMVAVRYAR